MWCLLIVAWVGLIMHLWRSSSHQTSSGGCEEGGGQGTPVRVSLPALKFLFSPPPPPLAHTHIHIHSFLRMLLWVSFLSYHVICACFTAPYVRCDLRTDDFVCVSMSGCLYAWRCWFLDLAVCACHCQYVACRVALRSSQGSVFEPLPTALFCL